MATQTVVNQNGLKAGSLSLRSISSGTYGAKGQHLSAGYAECTCF